MNFSLIEWFLQREDLHGLLKQAKKQAQTLMIMVPEIKQILESVFKKKVKHSWKESVLGWRPTIGGYGTSYSFT